MKWISICFNIDYDDGTMQLYLNGKPLEGEQRKPMALPANGKVVYRIFFELIKEVEGELSGKKLTFSSSSVDSGFFFSAFVN